MPKNTLYIRPAKNFTLASSQGWIDAFVEFGMSMDSTALSALMTPAANKEYVTNSSRLEHGTQLVMANPKKEARTVNVSFNLTAPNEEIFFIRYQKLCDLLDGGAFWLRTKYQPDVAYKVVYESCQQFTQFMRGIAKFSLRVTEPNPTDRLW